MKETKTVFITVGGEIMHKVTVLRSCSLNHDWVQAIRPDLATVKYKIEYVK